jgi:hypothetical protein
MLPALNDPKFLPTSLTVQTAAPPRPTLAIRELSRLIADVRRARCQFESLDEDQPTIGLEMVIGADPRD